MPDQFATVRIGRLVRDETGQEVVRILPDGLGDDQRRASIDMGEDLHAFFLRCDEAVALRLLEGMCAHELVPEVRHRGGELLFHRGLGRPAFLVGGEAQVAIGDEQDGFPVPGGLLLHGNRCGGSNLTLSGPGGE